MDVKTEVNEWTWQARSHIESGNIHAIVDESLDRGYDLQSVWKIAEVVIMCVKPKGAQRPPISEVLKEIQDAIAIERGPQEMQRSIIQQQLLVSNSNRSMGGASSSANNNSGSTWSRTEHPSTSCSCGRVSDEMRILQQSSALFVCTVLYLCMYELPVLSPRSRFHSCRCHRESLSCM